MSRFAADRLTLLLARNPNDARAKRFLEAERK